MITFFIVVFTARTFQLSFQAIICNMGWCYVKQFYSAIGSQPSRYSKTINTLMKQLELSN